MPSQMSVTFHFQYENLYQDKCSCHMCSSSQVTKLLKILMPQCLLFLGTDCLKITWPFNFGIISSITTRSKRSKILANKSFSTSKAFSASTMSQLYQWHDVSYYFQQNVKRTVYESIKHVSWCYWKIVSVNCSCVVQYCRLHPMSFQSVNLYPRTAVYHTLSL